MVAIDGRQAYSIGLTYEDELAIMADKFGCTDASNMDGGNSTCMYYGGQIVNRSANQSAETRYLPDAWLVSPLPANYTRPAGVPDHVVLPENPIGEHKEYVGEADPETAQRLFEFACLFADKYYGYFGTANIDYYYPELLRFMAEGSDLRWRADISLYDKTYINTYRNEVGNFALEGAYVNPDGSYDVVISSDVTEYATYWTYEAAGTTLRITCYEDPDSYYGFLATDTF